MMDLKGSYMLIILIRGSLRVKPGSLPPARLPPGYYVYVGSAMGPGGFERRVSRHLRRVKRARWHIDYLTKLRMVEIRRAFYIRLPYGESKLTGLLSSLGFQKIVKGFGSTDSQDFTHLFLSKEGLEETVGVISSAMRSAGIRFRVFDEGSLKGLSKGSSDV